MAANFAGVCRIGAKTGKLSVREALTGDGPEGDTQAQGVLYVWKGSGTEAGDQWGEEEKSGEEGLRLEEEKEVSVRMFSPVGAESLVTSIFRLGTAQTIGVYVGSEAKSPEENHGCE